MKIKETQDAIENLTLQEKIDLLKLLANVPSIKEKIQVLEKELNFKVLD